jgi:hypothetical protein
MLVARHICLSNFKFCTQINKKLCLSFQVCQNFHDAQKMQIVCEEQQDAFG